MNRRTDSLAPHDYASYYICKYRQARKMRNGLTFVKYIGGDKRLLGKTALAKPTRGNDIYVQFDELGLTIKGVLLSHGWHAFQRKDFVELRDTNE